MDAASLERHGPLGRFAAPVEAEYQRWMNRRLFPLVAALGFSSAVAWVAAPPAAYAVADDLDLSVIVISSIVNFTGILFAIAWAARRRDRVVAVLGTLGIALTAIDSLAVIGPA